MRFNKLKLTFKGYSRRKVGTLFEFKVVIEIGEIN